MQKRMVWVAAEGFLFNIVTKLSGFYEKQKNLLGGKEHSKDQKFSWILWTTKTNNTQIEFSQEEEFLLLIYNQDMGKDVTIIFNDITYGISNFNSVVLGKIWKWSVTATKGQPNRGFAKIKYLSVNGVFKENLLAKPLLAQILLFMSGALNF